VIPAETELTLTASAWALAFAWAVARRTRYLQPEAATALAAVFTPLLALAWAYMALMRILVP
jgi:hypothetical protein